MLSDRQMFLQHLAPTSRSPLMLEIDRAKGIYMYGADGKKYMDLISGISVSHLGHRHPKVVNAIKKQMDHYMHLMVYGEYVQHPQVQLAKLLTGHLPKQLNCVYFTNSGAEATEGAMKLSKRLTGRTEIIAFRNAYHGSTQGALSVMGNEHFKNAFRPLLPNIRFLEFNNAKDLDKISTQTAAVIAEPIQAEAGVILPQKDFLKKLKKRCRATGALLILDEIQTGMGRTGTLFAFEQYAVTPDILLLAKSLGSGMPLGAFISSQKLLSSLAHHPPLGHITTFGGHPVCCAAGHAGLSYLLKTKLHLQVPKKEKLFHQFLVHPQIKSFRSKGLLMALEFDLWETNKKVIDDCIQNGVVTDWFLFAPHCMRLAPPLTITEKEIRKACTIIMQSINRVTRR